MNLGSDPTGAVDLSVASGKTQNEGAEDLIVRLERLASTRAEHPAIGFGEGRVSYRALVGRVARLAARLQKLGVGPESAVGVCLPRGEDELVAMLAIWAAGGAYVPVDMTHPAERVRMILEDAAPRLLITDSLHRKSVALLEGALILALDTEADAIAREFPLKLVAPEDPEQLAYVLFTSGSTGRPKGVAISRSAIANFLRSMAHTPGLTTDDRVLAVTTTTFDIAALELFLPLYVGATVFIADRDTAKNASKISAQIERDAITVFQSTPTGLRLLLEAGWPCTARPLKVLCGGEAMSRELATRILAKGAELWNMYGPTETTVWSTVSPVHLVEGMPISIGRPIDSTQVYVLNEARELLPRGEIGELYIGGAGVARGYLHRADLTKERFIQNPFGPHGDIIYRTGDLARFLPDGTLECLGRVDHQVKIRGFRIELGEIESCLRGVPHLKEVVVVARSDEGAEPALVAYWVGEDDVVEEALEAWTQHRLPDYMRPSAFVRVAEMPLNTNGKIDRNKLPAPTRRVAPSYPGRPPANDTETRMAAIFASVLGLSSVPVDRDFFELGGTSVRALTLRQRIEEEFRIALPASAVFDSPTVERLCRFGHGASKDAPIWVELRRAKSGAPPLICLLGVTLYRELALSLAKDRTVIGVHIPYRFEPARGTPTVEDLARVYTREIRARIPKGPYHLAGLCFGGVVAVEVARQLMQEGEAVDNIAVFDTILPSAIRFDAFGRFENLSANVRDNPLGVAAELADIAQKRLLRWVKARLHRVRKERRAAPEAGADIDLPGSLADLMTQEYESKLVSLGVPFQVFKADARPEMRWYEIDPDHGWSRCARSVEPYSLSTTHLELLQEPHVQTVARALDQAL